MDPGLDPESNDGQNGLRGRDLIGLGGLLAGSVVAGLVLGVFADDAAGSSPVFTMVGIFSGMVLGGIGFWLRVRSALRG